VAVFLWRRQWAKKGFFPTFVPVVSVAPAAVLALNGSGLSIVGGALLGAIVAPPLAAAIAGRLPEDFHPFIGNVASMTISTALIVPSLILLTRFC
jgi:MFS transporter, ENTS family, enterobactin (siderophore) exporter